MCINFISRLIDTARLVDAVITMTSTQLDLSTPLQLFHFFINYYYHHYFFFFSFFSPFFNRVSHQQPTKAGQSGNQLS